MCKKKFENNLFFILLAYGFCSLYILVSYQYALNFEFNGDTQEYYSAFNKIISNPFPWGGEFVTSCIMWLINLVGGDFRFFLFICLLIWSPVVLYLAYSAKNNVFLFVACLFFLLPLFMGNVLFLIRQFHAALFFLIFIYCYNKKKSKSILLLFIILSIGSHFSAVMWFVFFSKKVKLYCAKPIVVFLITFISFLMFAMQVDVLSMLVNLFIEFSSVLGINEIERKLLYYTSGHSMHVGSVSYPFVLLSFIIAFLSVFLLVKGKGDNSLYLLALIQSLLLLTLSDNVVAANRFGFFAFYFCIPLVLIFFSFCFKKNRVKF